MPLIKPTPGQRDWADELNDALDYLNNQSGSNGPVAVDLAAHEADTTNPHAVTKAQVGLGNVNNTSDADKPVSTATLAALSGAIAKPAGPVAGDLLRYNGTEWAKTTTRMFEGTGNPNGVVAAPVGSTFVNTETGGWNGARTWRKTSGTGNTGWTVENGDTGWRLLDGILANGWTGPTSSVGPGIRRINSTIHIRVRGLRPGAIPTSSIFIEKISVGFRPNSADGGLTIFGADVRSIQADTVGNIKALGASTMAAGAAGTVSFTTENSWPTTLPGTPA